MRKSAVSYTHLDVYKRQQQEFSQEESQKLSWHVVHDADDEYGNPTQWSATLSLIHI